MGQVSCNMVRLKEILCAPGQYMNAYTVHPDWPTLGVEKKISFFLPCCHIILYMNQSGWMVHVFTCRPRCKKHFSLRQDFEWFSYVHLGFVHPNELSILKKALVQIEYGPDSQDKAIIAKDGFGPSLVAAPRVFHKVRTQG